VKNKEEKGGLRDGENRGSIAEALYQLWKVGCGFSKVGI
jgi:hypothetical protein